MRRPLAARLLPHRFKQSAYYRYYHARHNDWLGLFEAAPLALAPRLAMYGLIPGDVISGNIAFTGFYELAASQCLVQWARKGGLFVDVGANMGYFSLLWAGVNSAGRVIAFEAAPRNIALFQDNIRQNHLSERIFLVPKAAGERAGTIAFETGPADQTGWGGISAGGGKGAIEVPLVRLDQELADTRIDVLKVDVEGADTWVLRGCETLLRKKLIGIILFEQNTTRMARLGIAPGEAQSFLRELGYTCVADGKAEAEWMAWPESRSG
jgi:FkbM family methyltransferase